jgi:hypothetical protein
MRSKPPFAAEFDITMNRGIEHHIDHAVDMAIY